MKFYKENFPYYDRAYLFIEGQETLLGRMLNDYPGKEFVRNSDDFSVALIFLASYLMRADGKRSRDEFEFVADYFTKYHKGNRKLGLEAANLARYIDYTAAEYGEICETIKKYARKSGKLQLIDFLCDLAFADGRYLNNEHKTIQVIGYKIGLFKSDFMPIIQSNIAQRKGTDSSEQRTKAKTKTRSKKKARPARKSGMGMAMACSILGVPRNCTAEELKKSYRKLARMHHPDKVAYLGPEHVKKASKRFDQIADAYRYIKERKGF